MQNWSPWSTPFSYLNTRFSRITVALPEMKHISRCLGLQLESESQFRMRSAELSPFHYSFLPFYFHLMDFLILFIKSFILAISQSQCSSKEDSAKEETSVISQWMGIEKDIARINCSLAVATAAEEEEATVIKSMICSSSSPSIG